MADPDVAGESGARRPLMVEQSDHLPALNCTPDLFDGDTMGEELGEPCSRPIEHRRVGVAPRGCGRSVVVHPGR